MPYLNLRISQNETSETVDKLVSTLMKHTTDILGKKPEVTSIVIDQIAAQSWFVGGKRISEQNAVTFYLDIKITDGTNTKKEKSEYIKHVFAEFETILGSITPASYIVIHDVRADAWGFQGLTQEYRFIQSQSL